VKKVITKVPAKNKEQMIETKPKRVGTTIGIKGHDILKRVYGQDGKSPTITAHAARGSAPKIETKPKKAYDIPREILKDNERQRRVYDPSGKSPTVLARSDSPKITTPKQVGKIKDGGQGNRIYSQDGKSSTLSAQSGGTAGNGNTLVETKPKQVGIAVDIKGHDQIKRVYSPDGKSPTVTTCGGGHREPKVVTGGAFRARSKDEDGKHVDWKETKPKQMLELRKDQKSNAISTVGKDSLVVNSYREVRTEEAKRLRKEMRQKTGKDHTPFRAKKLEPRKDGKVGTVTPSLNKDHEISIEKEELTWRKLSCRECERLQTVPDDYTNHVSNTRRYAMLGNGWTVEVIKHIYKNMEL
jgi:site-specific DNA-cytosine methylase